jgi:hypothetical protein
VVVLLHPEAAWAAASLSSPELALRAAELPFASLRRPERSLRCRQAMASNENSRHGPTAIGNR